MHFWLLLFCVTSLFSTADDHTVVLWDLRGGKKLSTFKGHTCVTTWPQFAFPKLHFSSRSD